MKQLASLSIAMIGMMALFSLEIRGQGPGFLQLPFDPNQTYRINSYVDHDVPEHDNKNGTIVLFNGERYGNCPASGSNWTAGDGQGPYCYDSHSGIDWPMEEGTLILTAASGTVVRVGEDEGYGNFVRISHDNGYDTLYGHLQDSLVQVGDKVKIGDEIGHSGNTGDSSGPHLHFEVRHSHNQLSTDPFGWQGEGDDPLIEFSGEAATCLWANEWCHETMVEDGDANYDRTTVKFAQFGDEQLWQWTSRGNAWTAKFLTAVEGDETAYAYWIPYLPPGPYQVWAFIPDIPDQTKTTVTYTIHDSDSQHTRSVNQAAYNNRWVNLGTYNFGSGGNNYVKLTNSVGDASGGKVVVFDTIKFRSYQTFLPLVSKSNDSSVPQNCDWTVDNVAKNSGFGGKLANWQVWIDENDFHNHNLIDNDRYDPGEGSPAAFLGGEDDAHQPTNGDRSDQYIAQTVQLPDNTEAVALEYSYCVETQETTTDQEFDKFYINLQDVLGGKFLLPQAIKHTNREAKGSCLSDSGNWQRVEKQIGGMHSYAGDTITLVFYSDVDAAEVLPDGTEKSTVSTFYFDAVKIKVCTTH